jgi:choline dehydrogenase-like flavoprotein
VWNVITGEEVSNFYVMDSSIFPTSVGANPMQTIYTFAKIFAARFIHGMDEVRRTPMQVTAEAHVEPMAGRAAAAIVGA